MRQPIQLHFDRESAKTRSSTPVLANDGGAGFWLASVAAGPGAAAAILSPHGNHMEPEFMNQGTPSLAEFMTALPQMGGDANLQHSPGTGGPMSPGGHHPGYHGIMDPHGVSDPSGVNVPEYPWMKEKKTTRKSSQQGIEMAEFVQVVEVVLPLLRQLGYISLGRGDLRFIKYIFVQDRRRNENSNLQIYLCKNSTCFQVNCSDSH